MTGRHLMMELSDLQSQAKLIALVQTTRSPMTWAEIAEQTGYDPETGMTILPKETK